MFCDGMPNMSDRRVDVSVVLPVYNESEALRPTLLEILEELAKLPHSYEIVLVDDGSTDNCLETVKDLDLRVIRHPYNRGGGVARVTGMRAARGAIILQSDADGTYPASAFGEMLRLMAEADLVVAARTSESASRLYVLRILTKWLIKTVAESLVHQKIPDLNSGLRAYRRDIALKYAYLYPVGHSIMSTMTIAFMSEGYRVKFHPIQYRKRIGTTSFHIVRDTYNYFLVTITTVAFFTPLRVLMPVFMTILMAATGFTVRDVFRRGLGPLTVLLWIVAALVMVMAIISEQVARLSRHVAWLSERDDRRDHG
jgi:polyisoprenyl-phosphate glycosyltransferase